MNKNRFVFFSQNTFSLDNENGFELADKDGIYLQSTGLIDASENKNEIFHGDTLKDQKLNEYIVVWMNQLSGFGLVLLSEEKDDEDYPFILSDFDISSHKLVVVSRYNGQHDLYV